METEQNQWATELREMPSTFCQALRTKDDWAIRCRPAQGEWSAIEVLGHMIDKMWLWSHRIERIMREEQPLLPDYDQDAGVREQGYQHADPAVLLEQFQQRCEHFATLVATLPSSALQREGVHSEFGIMTIRQCIEAALGSAPEHLAQLCAAQEAAILASEQVGVTKVNAHDFLKVEILSETQLAEVERLARVCNEYEGLDIKLNWNILRGHLPIRVTSFLYYEDKHLVGFLALYQFNSDEAEISGMVHPEFRRRGIFTQLVRVAEALCREAGIGRLLFIVDHHSGSGKVFVEALQTQQIEMYEHKMTLDKLILPGAFETELVFRQAQPDEVLVLQRLMAVAFDLSEEDAADWYKAENLEAPDARYYLALLNDVYIGKIDVSLSEYEALIYNFGILPQYRGRGFGRQMLARTIQELLATGQQRITLEVETANKNALGLYKSCGFKESSRYDYYAFDITKNLEFSR